MRQPAAVATLFLLVLLPAPAVAQRQQLQPSGDPAEVTLNINGKVGGKSFQAAGTGACRHAPEASIRGASASLWLVQFSSQHEGLKQLNLTLWRLKDGGPDQVSLSLETKSGTHRVESGAGDDQGEATVVILPNGPGGRLEITGKDADGKRMQLAIECPAFSSVEAEGG
ncbi:MAG TPA: hypothetical protein VIM84_10865 [Gemmatimonadales bacterium]